MKKIKMQARIKIKASVFMIMIFSIGFMSISLNLFLNKIISMNKDPLSKDYMDNLKLSGSYTDVFINGTGTGVGAHNWTWAATQSWCSGGPGTSVDPYIIDGHTFYSIGSIGSGLQIFHSRKHFIIRNCIFKNSTVGFSGLYLQNTTNGVISNNDFFHNGAGIYLLNSSKITINGNTIYDNYYGGIILRVDSHNNIISGNTINNNSQHGFYLEDSYLNEISGNIVYNHTDDDIYLLDSNSNNLTGNSLYDSKGHSIMCFRSNDTIIELNNINNAKLNGIFLLDSKFNSLQENNIFDNMGNGTALDGSFNNTIVDNNIFDNLQYGISLRWGTGNWWSDNNSITENRIYHNNKSGIIVEDGCIRISIWDNYIYDHTMHGIYIYIGYFLKIYRNWIYNNTKTGINITATSQYNRFYENVFVGNSKHAVDDGASNKWNTTTIGNYWDNHTGPDASPVDGIVDIQYNISGSANSIDYLPIAEDGAPRITILSPSGGDAFNEIAPDFSLTITEDYLVSRWYTIDNSATSYPFTGLSGTIDQTGWDALSDGNVTFTFYARDLAGNTGSKDVIIQKDTQAPVIIINSPTSGEEFGSTPPTFNITVTDPNLNSTWYTLDGNITILGNILVWTIPQEVWDAIPEGSATITVYANDTLGHTSSQSITLTKSIPSRGIGLDYFMMGLLITLFYSVGIVVVITKMYRKKQILI